MKLSGVIAATTIIATLFATAPSFAQMALFGTKGLSAANSLPIVKVEGCHGSWKRHYEPKYDRRTRHRHDVQECWATKEPLYEDDYEPPRRVHCHDYGEKHWHESWGRVVHHHAQDSCRVRQYQEYRGAKRKGCIKLGIITFCP